ncbi:hypothetical protein K456DRAFT_1938436 [Colletotrichum gloeosporioides 23]|nr:hypothetical protein K456DRAFT_1938436 [Colletotrichum gloeosporioides 23]
MSPTKLAFNMSPVRSLLIIPPELLQIIVFFLPWNDLRNIHLTCRNLRELSRPRLFRCISVSTLREDLDKLVRICSNDCIRPLVQEANFDEFVSGDQIHALFRDERVHEAHPWSSVLLSTEETCLLHFKTVVRMNNTSTGQYSEADFKATLLALLKRLPNLTAVTFQPINHSRVASLGERAACIARAAILAANTPVSTAEPNDGLFETILPLMEVPVTSLKWTEGVAQSGPHPLQKIPVNAFGNLSVIDLLLNASPLPRALSTRLATCIHAADKIRDLSISWSAHPCDQNGFFSRLCSRLRSSRWKYIRCFRTKRLVVHDKDVREFITLHGSLQIFSTDDVLHLPSSEKQVEYGSESESDFSDFPDDDREGEEEEEEEEEGWAKVQEKEDCESQATNGDDMSTASSEDDDMSEASDEVDLLLNFAF